MMLYIYENVFDVLDSVLALWNIQFSFNFYCRKKMQKYNPVFKSYLGCCMSEDNEEINEIRKRIQATNRAVSYTHLDVYKRQVQ